jgi:hypothetical protein
MYLSTYLLKAEHGHNISDGFNDGTDGLLGRVGCMLGCYLSPCLMGCRGWLGRPEYGELQLLVLERWIV